MAVVSLVHDASVGYPAAGGHGPVRPYPESSFPDEPPGANRVYDLVRRALETAGADAGRFGTPAWNPLGDWIAPGQRVFVLPNFVVDRRGGESEIDFQGKCTNAAILRPVLDYAARASGGWEHVRFGNAALQSCEYDRVSEQTGAAALGRFYREHTGMEIGPFDLRAVVSRWTRYGAMLDRREQNLDDVVLVDLGPSSLLDEFYQGGGSVEVRVSDYDHHEIAEYHGPGRHVYAVHRAVLDADVLISVPKLKTHEKVGITCALKGTVGSIARKECLAHHRKGGPDRQGDEYPRATPIHDLASELADRVSVLDSGVSSNAMRIAGKGLYRALRFGPTGIMSGAWHGNDTAWRMALDIARILRHARPDGTLAERPQRRHVVFVDGVVGGEGEGPVYPTGRRDGLVIFGSDPAWTDVVATRVMGFEPSEIALISHGVAAMPLPVTDESEGDVRLVVNGRRASWDELGTQLDRPYMPPKGWRGHIERQPGG